MRDDNRIKVLIAEDEAHLGSILRKFLEGRGYQVSVHTDGRSALDALRAEKLLDDRRYTENFVAYHAARGQGPIRVRADLRRHGLEGILVEECLDAFPDWIVHLRKAQQKKFGANSPSNYADKQRQARFLGYRGFTSAQIRTALGFDIDLDTETEET